jgi:hypothetical protein
LGSVSDAKLSHDWTAVALGSALMAAAASVPATRSGVIKGRFIEPPIRASHTPDLSGEQWNSTPATIDGQLLLIRH